VDGSVQRIGYGYDGQGNTALVTSYSAATGGSIVNQVQRGYNGLGQLTADSQYHGDPALVSPGVVGYAYAELANGANNSRLLSLTYPNGRVLYDNYASGLDSSISRLTSLSDNADGTGVLESYRYLGLATVVERDHPGSQVNQTYISQTGGTGDGGDKYVGLDRFGRVVDQNWYPSGGATAHEEYGYGYDRDGNRLYRQDFQHSGSDDLYAYDGLSQLATFQRGMLNASHTGLTGPASHSQVWTVDALGNFTQVQTDGQTQPPVRTYNQQNELTALGAAPLSYDNNGNLTSDGSTSPTSTYSYDAWNRLVSASTPSGSVTYQYDGLWRRIVETSSGVSTDLYYSGQWQVLEERPGGAAPRLQYVWSPVYVDALVARDARDPGTGVLLGRLYAVQDANWNVTAVVNTSGQEVERYRYDPYGAVTFLDAGGNTLSGSTVGWRYLFQGGRLDPTSGLDDFRARGYSPVLGRWLQNDPLGFGAGDPNLYRYVRNAPLNATDPLGLIETTGEDDIHRVSDRDQKKTKTFFDLPIPGTARNYYYHEDLTYGIQDYTDKKGCPRCRLRIQYIYLYGKKLDLQPFVTSIANGVKRAGVVGAQIAIDTLETSIKNFSDYSYDKVRINDDVNFEGKCKDVAKADFVRKLGLETMRTKFNELIKINKPTRAQQDEMAILNKKLEIYRYIFDAQFK
jgi:RHS repeat-associated protein